MGVFITGKSSRRCSVSPFFSFIWADCLLMAITLTMLTKLSTASEIDVTIFTVVQVIIIFHARCIRFISSRVISATGGSCDGRGDKGRGTIIFRFFTLRWFTGFSYHNIIVNPILFSILKSSQVFFVTELQIVGHISVIRLCWLSPRRCQTMLWSNKAWFVRIVQVCDYKWLLCHHTIVWHFF